MCNSNDSEWVGFFRSPHTGCTGYLNWAWAYDDYEVETNGLVPLSDT